MFPGEIALVLALIVVLATGVRAAGPVENPFRAGVTAAESRKAAWHSTI
jgi:hypothetical protein